MGERRNVSHIAAENSPVEPAGPNQSLDQMDVFDLAGIECGVKAQDTTFFHVNLGRKEDVRGKHDGR